MLLLAMRTLSSIILPATGLVTLLMYRIMYDSFMGAQLHV